MKSIVNNCSRLNCLSNFFRIKDYLKLIIKTESPFQNRHRVTNQWPNVCQLFTRKLISFRKLSRQWDWGNCPFELPDKPLCPAQLKIFHLINIFKNIYFVQNDNNLMNVKKKRVNFETYTSQKNISKGLMWHALLMIKVETGFNNLIFGSHQNCKLKNIRQNAMSWIPENFGPVFHLIHHANNRHQTNDTSFCNWKLKGTKKKFRLTGTFKNHNFTFFASPQIKLETVILQKLNLELRSTQSSSYPMTSSQEVSCSILGQQQFWHLEISFGWIKQGDESIPQKTQPNVL